MTKTNYLTTDLKKSLAKLEQAIAEPESELIRDATIQRFEFTFELSWKLMATLLQEQNAVTHGTKNIIRKSAQLEIIDNPEVWFEYLEARNLTVHTYKENTAKLVYAKAKTFPALVHQLLQTISTTYY